MTHRKTYKNLIALALFGAVLVVSGCGSKAEAAQTDAAPSAELATAGKSENIAVADVMESEMVLTAADAAKNETAAVDANARYLEEVQTLLNERETLLANQLEQSKQALVDLDAQSQAQIAELQSQIDALVTEATQKQATVQALQKDVLTVQQAMQQDAQSLQNEMLAWQANDARLTEELNNAIAQLQTAYNEIAARQQAQAVAYASTNNNNGGNSDNQRYYDDYDDDDDDDHEKKHKEKKHDDDDHEKKHKEKKHDDD